MKVSAEQRNTCVFADKKYTNQCSALNEYYCEGSQEECGFYKSADRYELDEHGFVRKKKVVK